MRRGQVTAFIIVGLVMLIILALTMFLLGKIRQPTEKLPVKGEDLEFETCVRKAAEVALQSVGQQGGVGITAANGRPLVNTQLVKLGIAYDPASYGLGGRYGSIALQPLCLRRGPNAPNASGNDANSCMQGTYQLFEGPDEVIQGALPALISENIATCGYPGTTVSVLYGDDDVSIFSVNSSVRIPVRFKRTYDAAFAIALRDITDPYFDKRGATSVQGCNEPRNGNECLFPGMSVTSRVDGTERVVEVADNAKRLRGVPFIFRFTVQNRPPIIVSVQPSALISISKNELESSTPRTVLVHAADPDEDPITMSCPGAPGTITCVPDHAGTDFRNSLTITVPADCALYASGSVQLTAQACEVGGTCSTAPITLQLDASGRTQCGLPP